MKLAIMQPYFLPYIGYWQLMKYVDKYVIYDNIEYTKKGWINRNRYLCEGKDKYFTLPLKKDSDYLYVMGRQLAEEFDKNKIVNQLKAAYKNAPYWKNVENILEEIFECRDKNLFGFIFSSVKIVRKWLDINSELIISSNINIDHHLKSSEKVKAICKALGADIYVNPIGGTELYHKKDFSEEGIELKFIKTRDSLRYMQYEDNFVPGLSIIDVLAFNSIDEVKQLLTEFDIIEGIE